MHKFLQKCQNLLPTTLLIPIFFLVGCKNDLDQKTPTALSSKKSGASNFVIDSTNFRRGESIFKSDCVACHSTRHSTDNYLLGVVQRVGPNYLKLYLTKQDSLINAKDNYALKVKRTYSNQANSHNFKYSDEQLNAIIEYLK